MEIIYAILDLIILKIGLIVFDIVFYSYVKKLENKYGLASWRVGLVLASGLLGIISLIAAFRYVCSSIFS